MLVRLITLVSLLGGTPVFGSILILNELVDNQLVIAAPSDSFAQLSLFVDVSSPVPIDLEVELINQIGNITYLDTFYLPSMIIDTLDFTFDFKNIYDLKVKDLSNNEIIYQVVGIGGTRKVIMVEGHSQAAGYKGLNNNHYLGIKSLNLSSTGFNWHQAVADSIYDDGFVGGFSFGIAENYHLSSGGENVLIYNQAVPGSVISDLIPGTQRFLDLKQAANLIEKADEMVVWIGGNDAYADGQNGIPQDSAWSLFGERIKMYRDSLFANLGIDKLYLVQEYSPIFSYYPDAEYLSGYSEEILDLNSDSVIVISSTNGQYLKDALHWNDSSLKEIARVLYYAMDEQNYHLPEVVQANWFSGVVSLTLNKEITYMDSGFHEGFWGINQNNSIVFPIASSVFSGVNASTFEIIFNSLDTVKYISFGGVPSPSPATIPAAAKTIFNEGIAIFLEFPVKINSTLSMTNIQGFSGKMISCNDLMFTWEQSDENIMNIILERGSIVTGKFEEIASLSSLNGRNSWIEKVENVNGYQFRLVQKIGEQENFSNLIEINSQNCQESFLSVYPNPTNGQITIESMIPIEKIELNTIDGKRLYEAEVEQLNRNQLDLSSFNSGFYILNIITKKRISHLKITKQ